MDVSIDKWDDLVDTAVLAVASGSHGLFLDALESLNAIRYTT